MNDTENRNGRSPAVPDDIAQLIRYSGAREAVSRQRMDNARARVAGHWQGVVAEHRRERTQIRWRRFAVAASVLVVSGITLLMMLPGNAPVEGYYATVNRVIGDVRIDGALVREGARVTPGATIETSANSRIAMQLESGHALRLDSQSRIETLDPHRFELLRGAVYVDSGPDGRGAPVHIETRFGVAHDVGTQFQVRLLGDGLQVAVREGLVILARSNAQQLSIDSGSLVDVLASGETRERGIESDDPVWNWVTAIHANFDIENATLEQYLAWYVREAGLTLRWQDDASRRAAGRYRLSGSIAGLSLDDGFESVRRIAPFDYEVMGSTLVVQVN